jgi:HAD superfamily hydrolase (TIGR01509 family)
MYKAVVLAFDGVVLDSSGFRDEAYLKLFSELGIEMTPTRLHAKAGLPVRELIRSVVDGRMKDGKPVNLDGLRRRFYYELYNVYEKKSEPSPHLEDFLNYCEARKWKVGVASATPSNIMRMVLRKFGVLKRFRAVVGGEAVTSDKPDPEMLTRVLGKMAANPLSSIAIDSSARGIIAAKLIGMYAIAYTRYSQEIIREADLSVRDFKDIIGI